MIAAMAPRAILLDALGTLVALEPPAPRLRALLHERHGIEIAQADAERALRSEMGHHRRECIRAGDADALAALRLECAALLGREVGGAAAALPPADLVPTLLDSLRFVPFPEVPAALERWRAAGARLVVASNWDVSLHAVLRDTGLRGQLDGVATSAEVGAAKPAGELFAAASRSRGWMPAKRSTSATACMRTSRGSGGRDRARLASSRDTVAPHGGGEAESR